MTRSHADSARLVALLTAVLGLLAGLTVLPLPARAEVQQAPETPTIEFRPMCWVQTGPTPPTSATVTIVGHSFEPNVDVNVQDQSNPLAATNSATTDEYGTFSTVMNLTLAAYPGNKLVVTDAAGEHDLAKSVFGSCAYGVASARLMPACSNDAVPTMRIVGTGWAPSPADALIEILVDNQYDIADPIPPPANGNFDVTRSFSQTLTPGDHDIVVRQNGYVGGEQVVEEYDSMTFRVGNCPQATVTPLCAPSGGPPDRLTLTVAGQGFDPASGLHILFDPLGTPQEFVYQFPAPPTPEPSATGSPPPPLGDFGPISISPFARPADEYTIELIQRDSGNGVSRDWVTTVRFPCYQPSLSPPSPECGDSVIPGVAQQYSITVSGGDFAPSQSTTIVFDPDGAAGSEYPPVAFTGTTDAGGVLYAAINPSYRPSGTYRILAYQDTALGHVEASTTFTVPCIGPPISPPPSGEPTPSPLVTPLPPGVALITVNPTCAPAADGQVAAYALSLTGGGFLPGPVTVVLDPLGVPFTGTVQADVSGYVSASFVADGKPIGTYQLQAYQDNNGTHIEANTTLTIPCETVTISPTCASPADGLAGAYAITASGLGFDPGPVDLVFDPTGLTATATQVQADGTGTFTAPLTLTGKPPGVYDLVASQQSSYGLVTQASAQLLVPCGAVVMRITPGTGPRGFVPTVEGFGFPPNTTLTLKWDIGIGTSQTFSVVTDELGNFSRQMVIYQHDFLGLRHVTVQEPTNPLAYTDLTAPYLVAAAPIQPPFSSDDTGSPPPSPVIFQR
jgi:hypothetical protein